MPPSPNRDAQDAAPRAAQPLIDKLGRFVPLTHEEREALCNLARKPQRRHRGTDLIAEGDRPNSLYLLLEGWAFRYKQLESGRRQIMAYLVPGDLCDIRIFLSEEMDHSIGLLSDANVVKVPAAEMLDILDRFPRIERALLWATLVDEATLREWLLNVGQRNAVQKLGHLFCELYVRLRIVNLIHEKYTFVMPLTQPQLADTTGMTTVHVNRSLQRLRKDGLIATKGGKLTILNFKGLAAVAGFNELYLHTVGPPVEEKLRLRVATPG